MSEQPPRGHEAAYVVGRNGLLIPEYRVEHPDMPSWDVLHFFRNLWALNSIDIAEALETTDEPFSYTQMLPAVDKRPGALLTVYVRNEIANEQLSQSPPASYMRRRIDDGITIAGKSVSMRVGHETHAFYIANASKQHYPVIRVTKSHYRTSFRADGGEHIPPGLELFGRLLFKSEASLIPQQRDPNQHASSDILQKAMERVLASLY